MEIKCPHCASRFNLPDGVAKPGAKLRCTVCKNVFPLEENPAAGAESNASRTESKLPEMKPKKRRGKLLLWILLLLLLAGGGGFGAYYYFYLHKSPPKTEEDVAKNVELLTMRNVRQYNVLNEKVGKVFVIEGKVLNEFPKPKAFIELEGAIYDPAKKPLAVKKQLAGTQLSLFQLQVLSEKEMESFLNNKIEILANNTNVSPGGEVPFMILFYDPAANVSEFGVKIINAKDASSTGS